MSASDIRALIPNLWDALRPPNMAPSLAVSESTLEDAALEAAFRWHAAISELGPDVLGLTGRHAAYRDLPVLWRDSIIGPSLTVPPQQGPTVPSQFRRIHDATRNLTEALAWNIGEAAWLAWLGSARVASHIGKRSEHAQASAQYARALLSAGEREDALAALQASVELAPEAFEYWGSLGFGHLLLGSDSEQDADAAGRAFTRAMDELPNALRAEAAAFLVGYAALTDVLAGHPERALTRLDGLRAQGEEAPELRFQALRWAALAGADETLLAESLEWLALYDPSYYLRAATDGVLLMVEAGRRGLRIATERQRQILTRTIEDLTAEQRKVGQAARIGLRLPASAVASDLDISDATVGGAELFASRHAIATLAPAQKIALGAGRSGERALWEETERRLVTVTERLSALPKELRFRIPADRGIFADTVAMSDLSDWHVIETLASEGNLAHAVQYADSLSRALAQGYGVALAEHAHLLGHGLHGLAVYGRLVRLRRTPWTEEFCRSLQERAAEAEEVSNLLSTLAIAHDEARVAPQFRRAWAILQDISSLWDKARSMVEEVELVATKSQIYVAAGEWWAAEVYAADIEGYPVAGLPVFCRLEGDERVNIRWPYKSLAPGYGVTLATGRALLAVSSAGLLGEVPPGQVREVTLFAGLSPDTCNVPIKITVFGN